MVTLGHQWLVADRGAEVVLREILKLFPNAPLACLVREERFRPAWLDRRSIITSRLNGIPFGTKYYKEFLPIHPWAVKSIKVPSDTKYYISSDAAMIKGVRLPEGARQVCYCNSPPRYLWDESDNYMRNTSSVIDWARDAVFRRVSDYCRVFDKASAENVDSFIANSYFVAERIRRIYGRDSIVINPVVHIDDFTPVDGGDFYLIVSQMVPYKRIDIAVAACTRLNRALKVIGDGGELPRLKSIAGPTIQFLGRVSRQEVIVHMQACKAFLYPQVEDFGITAVEAQAAGKPVIALRAGGALETVVDGVTGLFFEQQSVDSMCEAIKQFENLERNDWAIDCRRNAQNFGPEQFRQRFKSHLAEVTDGDLFGDCRIKRDNK